MEGGKRMTVEDIEIIVTAKVEEALKEFEKMLPAIKKTMKEAQDAFSKVDAKAMTSKLHQAVNFMKKKMQDLKKSSENNEIAIKVNNKDAQKQISQIQKQIDSLQEKINARQMKLNVINPQIDKIVDDTRKSVTPDGINPNSKAMDTTVNNALSSNKDFTSLNSQAQKLYTEMEMYNKQLEQAKSKMAQLEQETNKTATAQNKLSSFFGAFKQKIEQVKPSISNIKNSFKGLPKLTQNITNNIKGMGIGVRNGLGHVLKYAGALFSMQSVYSALSGAAHTWLSSQNAGAKQLSANIEYMKYAMGSALAPVIQFVTNLVYQLLKAIQSVVYALFKVNIFANASASAFKNAQKQAKNTSKQLSNVHSEINNVGDHNSNTSPNVGDMSKLDSQMSPLSQKLYDFFKPLVDSWNKYGPALLEQIKTTAGQVTGLISAVWGSFEKIITNGTVYKSLELILAIIGNIAEAFANAWNYNGNGDAIVQNLANAFNNLLTAINNVVQSEGFQNWLNNCSDKFRIISEKIASINWQPLIDALARIGENIGTIALNILSGLVDIFKWFVEHPTVGEIILGIAIAIKTLSTALKLIKNVSKFIESIKSIGKICTEVGKGILTTIKVIIPKIETAIKTIKSILTGTAGGVILIIAGIVTAVTNFVSMLKDGFSWIKEMLMIIGIALVAVGAIILGAPALITAVIAGIVVAIATLVVLIKQHWEEIKEFFSKLGQNICDTFSNIGQWIGDRFNEAKDAVMNAFQNIGQWFSDRKNDICNAFSNIGNWFADKFKNAKEGVQNAFQNIGNWFSDRKNDITNIFSNIGQWFSDKFNNAVQGIKNAFGSVSSFFNEVWQGICNVFGNVTDWFRDKFSQAWQAVKNVFSTGGRIFDGIKEGILSGLKSIVNAIIYGINKVIRIPFTGLNTVLRNIRNAEILGLKPFSWIGTISVPQIPQLAKGGVLTEATTVLAGEYSGARTNPEIVTPQNIMRDTFEDVLSDFNSGNGQPLHVTIQYLGKEIFDDTIDYINSKTRRTGKNTIVTVGD
jgi:phage-related protein